MSNSQLPDVPSFRKQHLFLEFASLKRRCPAGIYLSLTPADPSQWSGVFFVRSGMPRIHRFAGYETKLSSDDQNLTMATGPYEPAVIRFHISFPSQYPDHPPLVTFATDLFHPLLVPLTTYTFSTSARNTTETVSASDEERLPPGGFSLRNGFPRWFRRQSRVAGEMMGSTARHHDSGTYSGAAVGSRDVSTESASVLGSEHQAQPFLLPSEAGVKTTGINEILDYMKSAFENPAMLDKLPLEAAGNPGAWHAWRIHRRLSMTTGRAISPTNDGASILPADGSQTLPSDWNWEGVWENRVRDGIQTSLSDPILFAPKSGRGGERKAEIIRFSKMDGEQLKEIREDMIRMQSASGKI